MVSGTHWISRGALTPPPLDADKTIAGERDLLHRQGFVKIVQDENGTAIKWAMFTGNWAALYFLMEWIHGCPGPYHLYYHSAGWFHEKYETVAEAADRMIQLLHKSDIHLSSTIYIHDANANRQDVPELLKTALHDNDADEEHSVDCLYDTSSRKFRVSRVGSQSTIAQLWGMSPVSYPCLTGHSYDQAVSRVYPLVTKTGDPHYDHIYAAMASPVGDVVWVPYQRVVLPLRNGRSKKGVRIVTELAKVDISPL
ncbi:MAG: hypothetical protein ACREDX_00285 [Aestuariivirga sp.]